MKSFGSQIKLKDIYSKLNKITQIKTNSVLAFIKFFALVIGNYQN